MATNAQNLASIKASLLASLALETAYQETHGPKPDYSLDGESYQWTAWREAILRKVTELNKLIQLEDGPWVIRSRARA